MHKFSRSTLWLALSTLTLTTAFAIGADFRGLGFTAPQVSGVANIYNPQIGDIVYDANTSSFYGYDQASTWQPLGSAAAAVPTGVVSSFAGSSAPTGYMLCDGSAISRTTYASLFSVIGTAYGAGDGTTTFNIPDFRGRFLRGVDGTAGNDPDKTTRTAMNTGGNTGNNVGSVQLDEIISHRHNGYSNGSGGSGLAASWITGSSNSLHPSFSAGPTGGNETRPKNAYVNYIIKL